MTRDELISALESAECGSRELDTAIAKARPGPLKLTSGPDGARYPDYTTNLQATLSLVPEGWEIKMMFNGLVYPAVAMTKGGRHYPSHQIYSDAATPQLALAAACIKAMERDDG